MITELSRFFNPFEAEDVADFICESNSNPLSGGFKFHFLEILRLGFCFFAEN